MLQDRTNDIFLWNYIGLENSNVILWKMYHKQRYCIEDLQKLPTWKTAEKIFVLDHEMLPENIAFLDQDPRVHLWDSGFHDHPRFFTHLWWFDWVREIERSVLYFNRLTIPENKKNQKYFDFLPGSPRTHKVFIRRLISHHDLSSKFLIGSKTTNYPGKPVLIDDWLPGGDFDSIPGRIIVYNGNCAAQSCCFIPYEIYNQTWYGLICETYGSGRVFFTEKTAKALIAGRIFVLIGPRHSLAKLRKFGFQTFGSIIDESYDDIESDKERWNAAFRACIDLIKRDPLETYKLCQSILDHNRQTISTEIWQNRLRQEIIHRLTFS